MKEHGIVAAGRPQNLHFHPGGPKKPEHPAGQNIPRMLLNEGNVVSSLNYVPEKYIKPLL